MGFFLGFCSILSFGPYFFVSLIWQPPCVCVLSRATLISCLSTPVKLYGVEPWVFTRVGRPALLLCGSLWGKESDRGQCHCWLTFGDLPGTHPFSSHFTHFPYVTGAPPAVVLVVDPKVRGFAYILGSPEKLAISSAVPTPTDFYSQKL